MKNTYRIEGDSAFIGVNGTNGKKLETIVDVSDLGRLMEFPNSWFAVWYAHTHSYYVKGKLPRNGGKQREVFMHRWLLNAPQELFVDHINHDTLDNRRENLRLVTPAQNNQNVRLMKSSSSGFRGVSWHKRSRKWIARVGIAKKDVYIGEYDDLMEAVKAVSEARKIFLPYSTEVF